jgi:hypothetical protein
VRKRPSSMLTCDLIRDGCSIYKFWSGYFQNASPSAVLQLDGRQPVKYFNSTAANRYRYGLKSGYHAHEITWDERNAFLADIHQVNTSLQKRQGRAMKDHYLAYPQASKDSEQCPAHYNSFVACFLDTNLVGYISTNFCGEIAAASQILGHGDHLKNGVMLVLWAEFVRLCQSRGISAIIYSRWSDGTDGLKYWKHSVGMKQITVKERNV